MSLLLSGLVGGFVATIVMSAFMMGMGGDSPPPTALFWSKYIGDGEADEYMMQGMVLHMFYGTGAGVVYGLLVGAGIVVTEGTTLLGAVNGAVYGVALFVIGAAFWFKVVLDMDPEPDEAARMAGFHIIYGLVLGAFVGAGILV